MTAPSHPPTFKTRLIRLAERFHLPRWWARPRADIVAQLHATNIRHIDILSVPATLYVAQLLRSALGTLGLTSSIHTQRPRTGFGSGLYIVIAPHAFKQLPKHYIAYQLEQHRSGVFNKPKRLKKLLNALYIMDYSLDNIRYFEQLGIPRARLFHAPIGAHAPHSDSDLQLDPDLQLAPIASQESTLPAQEPPTHSPYDIAFYGDTHNARRQTYLQHLGAHFALLTINNAYGNDAIVQLRRATIILNIHYYEDALLETTRLYECISQGMLVISESATDINEHNELGTIVDFVPVGDVHAMHARIQYWLDHPEQRRQRQQAIRAFARDNHATYINTLKPILSPVCTCTDPAHLEP